MRKLSPVARRRVRKTARRLLDHAAELDSTQWMRGSPEAVLAAAGHLAALRISVEVCGLPAGVLATTHVAESVATIRVSKRCASVRHTVAHELGHLLLGHTHVDHECFEVDLDQVACPPGFEKLHLAMARPESPQGAASVELAEAEAELFAEEVSRIAVVAGGTRLDRAWASGL